MDSNRWYNNFNELVVGQASLDNMVSSNSPFQNETLNMSPQTKNKPPFRGFRFYTYTNEKGHGGVVEPKHVHVHTPNGKAKFWIEAGATNDQVTLAENKGIPGPILRDIHRHIKDNRDGFIKDWNDEQQRQAATPQ